MNALDEINELAERSPGFVWRFQTDDGNATAERPYDDELIIVNLSTWESAQALSDFVYHSDHTAYLRRRREWFERFDGAYSVLWWVAAGHQPTVREAIDRLDHLTQHGATEAAFTFRQLFSPPHGDSPSS